MSDTFGRLLNGLDKCEWRSYKKAQHAHTKEIEGKYFKIVDPPEIVEKNAENKATQAENEEDAVEKVENEIAKIFQ